MTSGVPNKKELFFDLIFKTFDCWIWLGSYNENGYGVFHYDKKLKLAHRFSYEFYKGEIPKGLFVCHSCDNTACVNPDHLWLGTQEDNMNDMIAKGRGFLKTFRSYTDEEVMLVFKMFEEGASKGHISRTIGMSTRHITSILRGEDRKSVKLIYDKSNEKGLK
jgi:hypothetical protein